MTRRLMNGSARRRVIAVAACALLMALPLTVTMAAGLSKDEALKLARQSGCLTCHKIDSKLMGPAWADVAERYKGNPEARAMLIEKVRKGGRGNWSEVTHNMMMPPTPKRVSDDDIAKLVDFILSLDKG